MRSLLSPICAALSAALLFVASCGAFELPLSDKTIREAYFLGQHHDASTEAALMPYMHILQPPKRGPYISDIRVLTPYAQIIEASKSQSAGYSAQQAAADYHARQDTLIVRFHIEFTPSYGYLQASRDSNALATEKGLSIRNEDFWQAFHGGLSQNNDWIEPLFREGEPIFARTEDGGSMVGAYIWLTFDAHDVSSEPVDAEIFTPDGQHIVTTFDLSTLR